MGFSQAVFSHLPTDTGPAEVQSAHLALSASAECLLSSEPIPLVLLVHYKGLSVCFL